MAARLYPAPRAPDVVDLRRLTARDLEPLLREECAAWLDELAWDFEKSADLVRRFVDMRALSGAALIENDQVVAYMYWVLEEDKGLIGDLYVRRQYRGAARENLLIEAALEPIMLSPAISRIESQLMMIPYEPGRAIPRVNYSSTFARNFMQIDLKRASLGRGHVRKPMYVEKWHDHYVDAAAQLIAAAYDGHIDSRINDQYRSIAGARRFLHNIVQYPGCGAFYRPASYAAFDALTGRMIGVSLASIVAPDTGHITQICVAPSVRGTGVGHELLRQSLSTLREMGCATASLTVTAANDDAVSLYERVGFRVLRQFCAYVWEGF
jgi:ribosomal protein S18 acetylase RimI-like enzyme